MSIPFLIHLIEQKISIYDESNMYVNEQMTTREKKEKALNELRAFTMPIYTLNLKHRSEKKKNDYRLPVSVTKD
jgi:hypothetical protein